MEKNCYDPKYHGHYHKYAVDKEIEVKKQGVYKSIQQAVHECKPESLIQITSNIYQE